MNGYYRANKVFAGISDLDINKIENMVQAYRDCSSASLGYPLQAMHEHNLTRMGEFPAEYTKAILKVLRRQYNFSTDKIRRRKKELKNIVRFYQKYEGKCIRYRDRDRYIRVSETRSREGAIIGTIYSLKDGHDAGTAWFRPPQKLEYEVINEDPNFG